MDSLMNKLRQNGTIIVVGLQIFVCITINLLLIATVMLLTALLVGVIVVIPVSLWIMFMVVSYSHKVCFIAIQRKIKQTLVEKVVHFSTVWNIRIAHISSMNLDGIYINFT